MTFSFRSRAVEWQIDCFRVVRWAGKHPFLFNFSLGYLRCSLCFLIPLILLLQLYLWHVSLFLISLSCGEIFFIFDLSFSIYWWMIYIWNLNCVFSSSSIGFPCLLYCLFNCCTYTYSNCDYLAICNRRSYFCVMLVSLCLLLNFFITLSSTFYRRLHKFQSGMLKTQMEPAFCS